MSSPPTELSRWFAAEVQPHEEALRAWLRVRFPSVGDGDDVVQESYLRLVRAHETSPIRTAKAFLFTTARNLALNYLRHRRYERADALGEIDASSVLDDRPGIPETIARAHETESLNLAIQSLPERCREVFTLRRIHGLSQKEVAAKLGISEKTVEAQSVIALRKCVEYFRIHHDRAPVAAKSARPAAVAVH